MIPSIYPKAAGPEEGKRPSLSLSGEGQMQVQEQRFDPWRCASAAARSQPHSILDISYLVVMISCVRNRHWFMMADVNVPQTHKSEENNVILVSPDIKYH